MSLFIALIVGAAIGGAGGYLLRENMEVVLLSVLMGISGAIIGLAAYFFLLAGPGTALLLFSWGAFVCTIVFAAVFTAVFTLLHQVTPVRVEKDTPGKPEEEDTKAEKRIEKADN